MRIFRDEDVVGGIDFRRGMRRDGRGRLHILMPDRSGREWYESVMLIAVGLIGGFGLGLAFAMLMIVSRG